MSESNPGFGKNRKGALVRKRCAAVYLHGNGKALSAGSTDADGLVHNIMVGMIHPVSPARAEGFSVDKNRSFPSGIQVHDDPLSGCFRGDCERTKQPRVFPGAAPDRSSRPWRTGHGFSFGQSIINALGGGLGFMLALVIFSGVRKKLEYADIPETFKGVPATLIAASIVSVSFMGFAGLFN